MYLHLIFLSLKHVANRDLYSAETIPIVISFLQLIRCLTISEWRTVPLKTVGMFVKYVKQSPDELRFSLPLVRKLHLLKLLVLCQFSLSVFCCDCERNNVQQRLQLKFASAINLCSFWRNSKRTCIVKYSIPWAWLAKTKNDRPYLY